jgi:hypothetical protein
MFRYNHHSKETSLFQEYTDHQVSDQDLQCLNNPAALISTPGYNHSLKSFYIRNAKSGILPVG